jgi:3-oxoadipate enol-lactonase
MMSWYTTKGTRLAYWDSGAGRPIVFLHPTPLDHDYWRPLIEGAMNAGLGGVRVIVPDLRGHGVSELGEGLPVGGFARVPDAAVLSMEQLGEDVIALLDHLAVSKAVFVGCSIGGYVLLELWRKAAERMEGLAFVCSKAQPDAEANLVKRADTIAKVRAGGLDAFFDGSAQTLIGPTARRNTPEIVSEVRKQMTLTADAVVAVQAGLATRPDSLSTVAGITAPVLAIAGGEDTALSAQEMEAFKNALGGCTFHLIPDGGHFAAYEQPERVRSLLTEWLRKLR